MEKSRGERSDKVDHLIVWNLLLTLGKLTVGSIFIFLKLARIFYLFYTLYTSILFLASRFFIYYLFIFVLERVLSTAKILSSIR